MDFQQPEDVRTNCLFWPSKKYVTPDYIRGPHERTQTQRPREVGERREEVVRQKNDRGGRCMYILEVGANANTVINVRWET